MSEAPERLVLELRQGMTFDAWTECRDPRYAKSEPVEYVRADRVEELEANLAKALKVLECYAGHWVNDKTFIRTDDGGELASETIKELTGGKDGD